MFSGRYSCILLGLFVLKVYFQEVQLEELYPKCDPFEEVKHLNVNEYCLSEECVKTAAMILKNYDLQIEPCDDFYNFACGGFIRSAVIPNDSMQIDQFTILSDLVKDQLKSIIEKPIKGDEIDAIQKSKIFYKSCMDEEQIESIGLKEIKQFLSELGEWPVVTPDWEDNKFSWLETLYKFRQKGISFDFLFSFQIHADLKNSSTPINYLYKPNLALGQSHYSGDPNSLVLKAYLEYMVNISVALGANKTTADEDMKKVLQFETILANNSLTRQQMKNFRDIYNKTTIKDFSSKYPGIPWLEFINVVLATPSQSVTADEPIVTLDRNYFSNFKKIIETTPNRTLSNYLIWRAVLSITDYLNDEIRQITHAYLERLNGPRAQTSRTDTCMGMVKRNTPTAAGSLYVREFFDTDVKQVTEELVEQLKKEFNLILENATWLNKESWRTAKLKSDRMVSKVAFPNELFNDSLVNELYEGLDFTEQNYLDNILKVRLFVLNKTYSNWREPVKKEDWVENSFVSEVNGHYRAQKNQIELTAGFLQGVFFHKNRPKYANFGTVGYTIGHEISHAFDTNGRQFDQNGNERMWWTQQEDNHYKNVSQCFIEQYQNVTFPEVSLNINGLKTLAENIADNGGIKVAYGAYKKWVTSNREEKKLPCSS